MKYSKYIDFFDLKSSPEDFKYKYFKYSFISIFIIYIVWLILSDSWDSIAVDIPKFETLISSFLVFGLLLAVIIVIIVINNFFHHQILNGLRIFVYSFFTNIIFFISLGLLYIGVERSEHIEQLPVMILFFIIILAGVLVTLAGIWIGEFLLQLIANSISYPFRFMKVRFLIKSGKIPVESADTTIFGCYIFNRRFIKKYNLCRHNKLNSSCTCEKCGEKHHAWIHSSEIVYTSGSYGNDDSYTRYYSYCENCHAET